MDEKRKEKYRMSNKVSNIQYIVKNWSYVKGQSETIEIEAGL